VNAVTVGPPQCSTTSISKKPGAGSRQPANVRTGMLRLRFPSICEGRWDREFV
jgi:hypothetical protein